MTTQYKEVRALTRGIRLLEALAELGWAKPATLSQRLDIDRTTIYRLLSTLEAAGYVTRRAEDGSAGLTTRLTEVANGIPQVDLISHFVAPHLQDLTAKIIWPCDFAVLSGGHLCIQVSTHSMSAMSTHRAMIGKQRPLLRSALGKAVLSAMEDAELQKTLDIVERLGGPDAEDVNFRANVHRMLAEVRSRGYAFSIGMTEPNVSAIALPVRLNGQVIGAANIIFFRSAMTPDEAARKYRDDLRRCVDRIEAELAAHIGPDHGFLVSLRDRSGSPPPAP